MTEEQPPGPPPAKPVAGPGAEPVSEPGIERQEAERPDYKGAPLDAERGPGLGCFWVQVVAFAVLFVLIPIGVINAWPIELLTAMLIALLVLALFVGQTVIFLLRLVSADRRSRRRPLRAGARPTVGDLAAGPSDEAEPPPSVRQ